MNQSVEPCESGVEISLEPEKLLQSIEFESSGSADSFVCASSAQLVETSTEESTATEEKETATAEKEQAEEVEGAASSEEFTHLQQLFVTKNPVLCREVERNFNKLSRAHEAVLTERTRLADSPLPTRLQNAASAAFPFFLTLREFLVMLGTFLSLYTHLLNDFGFINSLNSLIPIHFTLIEFLLGMLL